MYKNNKNCTKMEKLDKHENKKKEILLKCSKKHGKIPIIKNMKGFLIDNRFMVCEKISQGAFGQIYSGYDMQTEFNGI